MYQKCQQIEAKIAYYRRLLAGVSDPTAIALLNLVIADLEADKARLRREDKKGCLKRGGWVEPLRNPSFGVEAA